MPWTFVHPAAVVPLQRWCSPLNFAALVIGTLTPDFGYYVNSSSLGTWGHTLLGGLAFDLPVGAMLLLVFYAVRKPLWFMLPQPHRDALTAAASTPLPTDAAGLLAVMVSIAIGAWTHLAWDALTHAGGWFVRHLALLRVTAFRIGHFDVPMYQLLQHLSSLVGAVVIIAAYLAWLRRARTPWVIRPTRADLWRFAFWLGALVIAGLVAIPLATYAAAGPLGEFRFPVFVVRGVILASMTFLPLTIVGATICYLARGRPAFQELTRSRAPD